MDSTVLGETDATACFSWKSALNGVQKLIFVLPEPKFRAELISGLDFYFFMPLKKNFTPEIDFLG